MIPTIHLLVSELLNTRELKPEHLGSISDRLRYADYEEQDLYALGTLLKAIENRVVQISRSLLSQKQCEHTLSTLLVWHLYLQNFCPRFRSDLLAGIQGITETIAENVKG